ncbi:helix-hairpin-helix domain-containing protein [Bdellovibrio bacteriovorus]|uniref:helix-hairpin-helix domain-containing protein n=1 Tax=Bdellovibrio TaxID=958 RepID=UPI0035A8292F
MSIKSINKATYEDLLRIPGVNSEIAAEILETRTKKGLFSNKGSLSSVPGLSQEVITELGKSFSFGEKKITEGVSGYILDKINPGVLDATQPAKPNAGSGGSDIKPSLPDITSIPSVLTFTHTSTISITNQTGFESSDISIVIEYSVAMDDLVVVRSTNAKPDYNYSNYTISIVEVFPVLLEKGIVAYAKLPSGVQTARTIFTEEQFQNGQLSLKLENAQPLTIAEPVSRDLYLQMPKYIQGRVLDSNNVEKMSNALVIIYTSTVENPTSSDYVISGYAETDSLGYFTIPYISGYFESAYALVGLKGESEVDIKLSDSDTDNFPEKLILVIDYEAPETEDCGCELDFTRDKQILEEFSYYTVVRITEPKVKGLTLTDTPDVKVRDLLGDMPWLLPGFLDSYKFMFGTGASSSSKDLIDDNSAISLLNNYSISRDVLSSYMLKKKSLSSKDIYELLQLNERSKLQSIVDRATADYGGRSRLDDTHVVDWDEDPTIYQATEIAHGHLLQFKQIWTADGYSIGDLLYSLPLAPGQKKQIVVYDWEHKTSGMRDDSLSYSERLDAEISRDRDINEIVNATLSESIDASSTAKSSSFSAGGGTGVAGFYGVAFGAVIGASGGSSKASSTASQDSFRETTGSSHQSLSDRTTQSASSVRNQRSTVIQTVSDGEKFQVTSESVANYNHCHSMTMQYFEVLRHFKVYQKLVGVQECLFVPLEMKPFDVYKANRWYDILNRSIYLPQYRKGLPAIKRYLDNWEHANFPDGKYCEEEVLNIKGDISVIFRLGCPANSSTDEFVAENWLWSSLLMPYTSASSFYNRYKAQQNALDDYFASEYGTKIAQEFVNKLRLYAIDKDGNATEVPIDCTLVSEFRNKVELKISIRSSGSMPKLTRESITQLKLSAQFGKDSISAFQTLFPDAYDLYSSLVPASYLLPTGSSVVVKSAKIAYSTEHFDGWLVSDTGVNNDITTADDVWLYTPLSQKEKHNPKDEDVTLCNNLIDHLNANIELYHKAIWVKMSPERRFMLLDGIVCTGTGVNGRSVASVVDNKVIGVVGNSLIMPVAPGQYINPTFKYPVDSTGKVIDLLELYRTNDPDPTTITVPTKGVFAEAVMGSCNSCEKIEEDRFWRWEQSPIPDSPTAIGSVDPNATRSQSLSNMTSEAFPNPIINIQNSPSAPDPQGLSSALSLVGKSDAFRDLTGLAANQANAIKALDSAYSSAQYYAGQAADLTKLALQGKMSKDMDRVIDKIEDSKAKGLISSEQANELTQKAINSAIGAGATSGKPLSSIESDKKMSDAQTSAVQAVASKGGSFSVRNTDGSTLEAEVTSTESSNDTDTTTSSGEDYMAAAVSELTNDSVVVPDSWGSELVDAVRGGSDV